MKQENTKFNKVLDILKSSKPLLNSTEDLEKEVIKRISTEHTPIINISTVIDFLFGWVYIGWVRRSLITASVFLVLLFVYQQGVILNQIEFLSQQIITGGDTKSSDEKKVEKLRMMYKKSGWGFPSGTTTITEKQMEELIESVNELRDKYKDIEKLIEEDPELKELIEKKMEETNREKNKSLIQ